MPDFSKEDNDRLRSELRRFGKRPSGWAGSERLSEVSAFIVGYSEGRDGDDGFVSGFQRWVSAHTDDRPEWFFPGIIAKSMFPESGGRLDDLSRHENRAAVARLFELLDEFLAAFPGGRPIPVTEGTVFDVELTHTCWAVGRVTGVKDGWVQGTFIGPFNGPAESPLETPASLRVIQVTEFESTGIGYGRWPIRDEPREVGLGDIDEVVGGRLSRRTVELSLARLLCAQPAGQDE